jgi:hypothetical protein
MFSVLWLFVGAILGLLIVSVFIPPFRPDMQLPSPHDRRPMRTNASCVKFNTMEVPCTLTATTLNFIASE